MDRGDELAALRRKKRRDEQQRQRRLRRQRERLCRSTSQAGLTWQPLAWLFLALLLWSTVQYIAF